MFKSEEDYYVQIGISAGGVCKSREDPSIFTRIEDPKIFEFITHQLRERPANSPTNTTTTSMTTTITTSTTTSKTTTESMTTIASTNLKSMYVLKILLQKLLKK